MDLILAGSGEQKSKGNNSQRLIRRDSIVPTKLTLTGGGRYEGKLDLCSEEKIQVGSIKTGKQTCRLFVQLRAREKRQVAKIGYGKQKNLNPRSGQGRKNRSNKKNEENRILS